MKYFTMICLLLAGCGSDGGGGTPLTGPYPLSSSCDTRTVAGGLVDQCRDWANPNGNADLEVSCNSLSGTFSTAACSTTNRTASCALAAVLGVTATYRYYSPTWNAGTAQTNCTALGGTFSAP